MLKKLYPPWDVQVYVKADDLNKMYFEKNMHPPWAAQVNVKTYNFNQMNVKRM